MAEIWRGVELEARFAGLTELLKRNEIFWREHAFKHLILPWEKSRAELSMQLRALPLDTAEQLAANNEALWQFFSEVFPVAASIRDVCELGAFVQTPISAVAEPRAIPGRKWQQIHAFSQCVPSGDRAILEWCSGKAHLGRMLARQRNAHAIALERNAQLVASGRALAQRERADVEFLCVDVLTSNVSSAFDEDRDAVALHACGDLHLQLLRVGVQRRARSFTLVPCCYQLVADSERVTASQAAIRSGLQLREQDLQTAMHGSFTAPLRERKRRQHLQAWRLGYDLLQRELRGVDAYLPTPSRSHSVLRNGFAAFCKSIAEHHRWLLPDDIDYAYFEAAGWRRLREVAALDLPRIAFRRALELWLALDRALYLRENGYEVEVGEFCAAPVTPRNILIRSVRDSA